MKPWMKERDLLVQQTLAFVQGVIAAKPTRTAPTDSVAAMSSISVSSVAASSIAASSVVVSPDGASPIATEHDEILRHPVSPPIFSQHLAPQKTLSQKTLSQKVVPPQLLPTVSERADILKRVAAFRAHQGRLLQERETYYETVQEKIRTVLGNEMTSGRLYPRSNDKTF